MPWKKYRNFLVTGVSGYYGSSLIRHFAEAEPPPKVVGIDIKRAGANYPFLDFRKMDIRDPNIAALIRDEKIDTVVHLAFVINVFMPDAKVRDININGARNVIECAARAGVKKFILVSSSTAVGAFPENEGVFDETAPHRVTPGLFYTRDKFEIENILIEYREKYPKTKFVTIRPSIITGREMGNIIAFFMKAAYFVPAPAGFNPPLQFVHEEDLARATALLMARDCEGVYNVTGDGGVPFREMMRLCGKRPLPAPRWLMLSVARRIDRFGVMAPFSGIVDLLSFPWMVGNERIKREFDFTFKYDSRSAFLEFAKRI